jgi:fatty-acyl-CoA synthase
MPPTLDDLLRDLAARHPDRPAAIGEHSQSTFLELDVAVDDWATRLRALGVGRGTHVGLLAANGPEWLTVAFAAWRCAATLVPLSTFATSRELGEILEHADVEVAVAQRRLRAHDLEKTLSAAPRPETLREVVWLDEPAPDPAAPGRGRRGAGAPPSRPRPDDIACILYTSGTTGAPKGVMLSHRAILATVAPTVERAGLDESDTLLSTLPLFWVAGLVIRALPTLASGCALVLPETFTAAGVIDLMRRHRLTGIHLRPPQVGQILSHPSFNPELLSRVRRGGGRTDWYAPHLDPEKARFITGYGMTETAGYVTVLDWRDPPETRRTGLGSPLPGVEIRIVGDDGEVLPPGEVGEIRIRAPGQFRGYHKQPPGTGLDEEGFVRTGDLGRLDADGTFHFDGRGKDLLRVKGINVSPVEVESVLATHPGVEAAYVVGLPPGGLEQSVVALIVPVATPPSEAELRELAARDLSHYKRPERYVYVNRDEIVLGATSKPQRAALAELAGRK